MTDEFSAPADDEETTIEQIFEEAHLNIKESITAFLQLIGEVTGHKVVTDWVVVAAVAGVNEEGEVEESDPIVLNRKFQPPWRTKGLLSDAITQDNVADYVRTFIQIQHHMEDGDDE